MKSNITVKMYRIRNGFINTFKKPYKYPYLYIFLIFACLTIYKICKINTGNSVIKSHLKNLTLTIVVIAILVLFIKTAIKVGTPFGTKRTHRALNKIGLTNHIGEIPILLEKYRLNDKLNVYIYIFLTNGISLDDFKRAQHRIETTLGIRIFDMKYTQNLKCIEIVTSTQNAHEIIEWNQTLLSKKDFELVLGETVTERLTVDLAKMPHLLIGGASGSGKSILLKLIVKQCLNKGAEIYLADFKGGIDFPRVWHEQCNLILREDDLINTLEKINDEMNLRKETFLKTDCSNIQEYNMKNNHMERIIFACDEIAQILDKTGATKERKEQITIIESYLATISQLGRAFGIHLILATQRPDSNILNGQIKSNISYRICGRADSILSSIILDSSLASSMIPKDSQGLFINQDSKIFQGYWFNDSEI